MIRQGEADGGEMVESYEKYTIYDARMVDDCECECPSRMRKSST